LKEPTKPRFETISDIAQKLAPERGSGANSEPRLGVNKHANPTKLGSGIEVPVLRFSLPANLRFRAARRATTKMA
jgi:hypothetical protein